MSENSARGALHVADCAVLAYEPLRVSLSDLLSADTRGKWWLVGAGWSGNPLAEREEAVAAQPKKSIKVKEEEEVLLEVARKQGMNTDVRRGVFVTLMTSEVSTILMKVSTSGLTRSQDYVHACDRLAQLRLTDVQQRELVRVALHCCGLEKMYNPYYTLILNHLCSASYDHRFTLQYALWDFLRGLDEGESAQSDAKARRRKTVNIAKAIAYIIARGSMDLTVFKVSRELSNVLTDAGHRLYGTPIVDHHLFDDVHIAPDHRHANAIAAFCPAQVLQEVCIRPGTRRRAL